MHLKTMKYNKPLSILTLAILALPGFSLADTFIKEESHEFNADSITKVVVDGQAADIDVTGWDEDRITVDIVRTVEADDEESADKILAQAEPRLTEEDGTLKVLLKGKEGGSWSLFGMFKKSPSASITVRLPHKMDLRLDTGSGNIKVDAVSGDLSLDSGSGNIIGNQLSGKIVADTGSGDVQFDDVDGSINADTGSGNVKVAGLSGELKADTGSGDVKASGAIVTFDADTGSGNVSINSSVAPTGKCIAAAGSGKVRVELPANAAFTISAGTGIGDVKCTFPVENEKDSKNTIKGDVNGGGPKLSLATGSGNIQVVAAD